jgi:hypothetical protein
MACWASAARALENFGTFERADAAGAIAHRWLTAQDYALPGPPKLFSKTKVYEIY